MKNEFNSFFANLSTKTILIFSGFLLSIYSHLSGRKSAECRKWTLLITLCIWKSSVTPPSHRPPPLPPSPLVSSPLHLCTWLIQPSICSHAPVRLMNFHWHFMLTYSDYCSAAPGGTGGPPSLQHGPVTRRRSLPSRAPLIREQGSWNGFDRIVPHLLRPSHHIPLLRLPSCRRRERSLPFAEALAP